MRFDGEALDMSTFEAWWRDFVLGCWKELDIR